MKLEQLIELTSDGNSALALRQLKRLQPPVEGLSAD